MASTYSPLLRYELIGSGEQAGVWGNTTNVNIGSLIEQSVAGVTNISATSLGGTTYTLTALNGAPDEARSMVLNFTGSASSTFTVIVPTSQKLYVVRNNTGQTINFKTAAQVTPQAVATSNSTMIFCDGVDVLPGIAAPSVGTLLVSGGGTGATSFTAGFIKSPGSTTALTSSSTVSLTTEVSGTLPVTSGGTGVASPTAGRLLIGNGTSAMTQLAGTATGNFLTWNGTSWAESSLLATGKGGTGLTTFTAGNRAIYSTDASTLTAGTLPTAAGGTGLTGYSSGSIVYASALNTLAALPIGPLNSVLTVSASGLPAWSSATGVTSLTAGTGISVSGSTGAVTVTNSGVTSLTAGTGITLSGSTGGITISASGTAGVSTFSAGTTGFTPSTGTSGAVTLAGTLVPANGGTGLTTFGGGNRALYSTSASALTAGTLPTGAGGTGLTSFTTNGAVYATSTSALTTGTLPVAAGGTGATSIGAAQTALQIPYGPIFSAYRDLNLTNQAQTLVSGTVYITLIQLNLEEYDSANAYNTSTYLFQPNVAGYYQLNGIARMGTGGGTTGNVVYACEIRKNGLATPGNLWRGQETSIYLASAASAVVQASISVIVYLNGSSDYVQLFAGMDTNGTSPTILDEYDSAGLTSRFQGSLIRYA